MGSGFRVCWCGEWRQGGRRTTPLSCKSRTPSTGKTRERGGLVEGARRLGPRESRSCTPLGCDLCGRACGALPHAGAATALSATSLPREERIRSRMPLPPPSLPASPLACAAGPSETPQWWPHGKEQELFKAGSGGGEKQAFSPHPSGHNPPLPAEHQGVGAAGALTVLDRQRGGQPVSPGSG